MADAIIMLRGHIAESYDALFPKLVRTWYVCPECGEYLVDSWPDCYCCACDYEGSDKRPFICLGQIPIGDTPLTYQPPVLI